MSLDPARRRAMENRDQLQKMKRSLEKGEMPRNEQLDHFLIQGREILEGSKQRVHDIEGKKVVEHTQNVLSTVKEFIDTKNRDETLQKIGEKAALILREGSSGMQRVSRTEKKRAKQLVTDIRGSLRILITSSNFRKTLLGLISLLAEIGNNLRTGYENEAEYPENLRLEPWEKMEDSIEIATQKMSKEKLDDFEDRVHRLLQEAGKTTAIRNFLDHFYSILGYFRTHTRAFQESSERATTERYARELLHEVEEFLSQFSPRENATNVGRSLQQLLDLSRQDEEVRVLGQEWKEYMDRSITNPDLAITQENKDELRKLVQKTRYEIQQPKLADPIHLLIRSMSSLIKDIQHDPLRMKMEEDIRALFRDLLIDPSGHIYLNQRALSQLRSAIIPSIIDQLRFIAIPKIQSYSSSRDLIIKDLFLSVPDIVPDKIQIESMMNASLRTKQLVFSEATTHLLITIANIQIHVRNAKVHFKRKSFPKIEDDLLINTDVYGSDTFIALPLTSELVEESGYSFLRFTAETPEIKLDHLKIEALEGKYDTIINVATKVLKPLIKSSIQRNVEKKMKEVMDRILGIFNDASRHAGRRLSSFRGSTAAQ